MKRYSLCTTFDIDYALSQPDEILGTMLVDRETGRSLAAAEVRAYLMTLKEEGYVSIPVCDKADARGFCQGHEIAANQEPGGEPGQGA